jgi:predicted RND superfamily exporter protein
MSVPASPQVLEFFLRVLRLRRWIVGAFLILTVAGIYGASRVPDDPAIDRLVVAGDPLARATLDFERVFPEGDQALIMLESSDPLSPAALRAASRVEGDLAKIPRVEAHSLLTLYRRGVRGDQLR